MIEHVVDGCICPGQWCPGCQRVKCRSAFHRCKRNRSGLQAYCKACQSAAKAVHRQSNLEESRAYARAWKQAYREANREQDREYQRTWRQSHPRYFQSERSRSYHKAYYEENRKRNREQNRAWQQNHPERVAIIRATRRTRETQAGGSFTSQQWESLKARYDYTCLRCGRQAPEITLTPDHVVPVSKGGTSDITNIQPLCFSCNSSKKAKVIDYRPKE